MPDLEEFADDWSKWVRQQRHYTGEGLAKRLIAWLEKNRSNAAGKRIAELLREMGEAAGMVQPGWGLDGEGEGMSCPIRKGKVDPAFTKFQQLHAAINRRLSRYRLYPQVGFGSLDNPSAWQVAWRPARKQQQIPSQGRPGSEEAAAVGLLLNLARQGAIQRVRECLECGTWFFARFEHSKFCQQKCQVKHYQSNPNWKAHRQE